MILEGYISVNKHPECDLYIYNYTKKTSGEHMWNEATEFCRGVICDKDYNIVARSFEKFYNYEELRNNNVEIPNLPFRVYEKLDGSLGILYYVNNEPFIATRGSFNSKQAIHATNLLHSKYANKLNLLDRSKTYLFEIIIPHGPESNLVVNYGDIDDLFLLAVIDIESGEESEISNYKHIFNVAKQYENVKDYLQLRDNSNGENREGFVIKFSNGFRMKLKFAEYFKAHVAKSYLNFKSIFESIENNTTESLRKNIESNLSEESVIYFDNLVNEIKSEYSIIENECKLEFRNDFESRKEMAAYFTKCKYPCILFAMIDGKEYSKMLWKIVASKFK
jgi:RNA ligase